MFEQISCGGCEKRLNDRLVTRLLAYPMVEGNHNALQRASKFRNRIQRFPVESWFKGEMQLAFLNRHSALKIAWLHFMRTKHMRTYLCAQLSCKILRDLYEV